MNTFDIRFSPPLRPAEPYPVPGHLADWLSVSFVQHVQAAYPHEHLVQYAVDGEIFAYYPASILTLLNDLDLELALFRRRENHDMTLSGYTVLHVEFQGDLARLFDPTRCDHHQHGEPLGDFAVADLESKFTSATSALWGLILSIQNHDGSVG